MELRAPTGTLSLQPLLVSQMRDKRTSIPIVDAGLLPSGPDLWNGFLYRSWALKVRRIGRELAHESH